MYKKYILKTLCACILLFSSINILAQPAVMGWSERQMLFANFESRTADMWDGTNDQSGNGYRYNATPTYVYTIGNLQGGTFYNTTVTIRNGVTVQNGTYFAFENSSGSTNASGVFFENITIPSDAPAMRLNRFRANRLLPTFGSPNNLYYTLEVAIVELSSGNTNPSTAQTGYSTIGSATLINSVPTYVPAAGTDAIRTMEPGKSYQLQWRVSENVTTYNNIYFDNPISYGYIIPRVQNQNIYTDCGNTTLTIAQLESRSGISKVPQYYEIRWFNSSGTQVTGSVGAGTYTPYYYRTSGSDVSNPYHPAGTPVTVTAATGPVITTQPNGYTVCQGSPFTALSVAATGATTYQWRRNGTNISGATNSTYTPTEAGTYSVVVANAQGCTTTSNNAIVVVNNPPAIVMPATSGPHCMESTVTLSPTSVTNAGGATYQWQVKQTTTSFWTAISDGTYSTTFSGHTINYTYSGATTSSLTIGNMPNFGGAQYRLIATASCGTTTSSEVTLDVKPRPGSFGITTQLATVCVGATVPTLTAVSTGVAEAGTPVYWRWYRNTVNSQSGATVVHEGASATTYDPPSPTAVGSVYYFVEADMSTGCTFKQYGITEIRTPNALVYNGTTANQNVCLNGTSSPISVSTTGGGDLPMAYQWYVNTSNSNVGGTAIPGETSSNYTPPTNVAGTSYYYAVVSRCYMEVRSNPVQVIVNPPTSITAQPSPATQTVNINATPASISVTAVGTGTLIYNWYRSVDGTTSTGILLQSGTSNTFAPPTRSTIGTDHYYVVISGTCQSAASNIASVVFESSVCSKPGVGGTASESYVGIMSKPTITADNWPRSVPNGYLVLDSATKGFVITHVQTTAQLSNITPITGMMVYDQQAKCVKIYRGSSPVVNPSHTGWVCIEKGCNQ